MSTVAGRVTDKTTCPHCWHAFDLDELLAIAQHPDLRGDPVAGDDAYKRFTPSRFTVDGHAMDARRVTCPEVACPQCHLVVPRAMLRSRPLAFALIGAPGSGKSFMLTSMTHELKRVLPNVFGMSFDETDAALNSVLVHYEKTLFVTAYGEEPVTLAKTQLEQGDLKTNVYDEILLNGVRTRLPRPFLFTLKALRDKRAVDRRCSAGPIFTALFDNAGEFFLPEYEHKTLPGVRHLVNSSGLFFLFDPTMDVEFRKRCPKDLAEKDPQLTETGRIEYQPRLLTDAINRIKTLSPSSTARDLDRPLIILLGKYDLLLRSEEKAGISDPWIPAKDKKPAALDLAAVGKASRKVRRVLRSICPQLVATAEGFSSNVTYLPCSAIGHSPKRSDKEKGGLVIRPVDIEPIWVAVPMIRMLAHFGVIATR